MSEKHRCANHKFIADAFTGKCRVYVNRPDGWWACLRDASDPIHSVPAAAPESCSDCQADGCGSPCRCTCHNAPASSPAPVAPAEPVSEPLPCPWCGGTPIVTQIHAKTAGWIVSCETDACRVSPMTDDFNTREEAIALWNQRK